MRLLILRIYRTLFEMQYKYKCIIYICNPLQNQTNCFVCFRALLKFMVEKGKSLNVPLYFNKLCKYRLNYNSDIKVMNKLLYVVSLVDFSRLSNTIVLFSKLFILTFSKHFLPSNFLLLQLNIMKKLNLATLFKLHLKFS